LSSPFFAALPLGELFGDDEVGFGGLEADTS
jgi:hypothetical protein